jgi:hypothetical protein
LCWFEIRSYNLFWFIFYLDIEMSRKFYDIGLMLNFAKIILVLMPKKT